MEELVLTPASEIRFVRHIEQVKGNILDNLPEILDVVSISSIQTPLLSAGVISPEDLEIIYNSSGCCREKTLQLIKLILHKGAEAIKLFLSALDTSCAKSTVQNLLQPRDVQKTSSCTGRYTKIGYIAYDEETGLLFEGKFVLELKRNARGEEKEKNIPAAYTKPRKDEKMETLSKEFFSSSNTKQIIMNVETQRQRQNLIEELKNLVGMTTNSPLTVAVIGTPGSGKSSFINTMITSMTGNYRHWTRTGDFGGSGQTPNFLDIAGFQDTNDEVTRELLNLLFYGRIPSDVPLDEVAEDIRQRGVTYTDIKYPEEQGNKKVDRIIFIASAVDLHLPVQLMHAVSTILRRRRDIPIFGVLTKRDRRRQNVREFEANEAIFKTTLGLAHLGYLQCTNYCDDNINKIRERTRKNYPELDIPVLRFLIQVFDPEQEAADFHRVRGFSWRRLKLGFWKIVARLRRADNIYLVFSIVVILLIAIMLQQVLF
ncbi:uncharacterized protein LOC134254432 [Saccostrea cucullata]|uniref:uncharacterized protein LOC134254432 n=1 Tax=Saccostrea cuccullata TaxID=36930 RepID=UPI002ED27974